MSNDAAGGLALANPREICPEGHGTTLPLSASEARLGDTLDDVAFRTIDGNLDERLNQVFGYYKNSNDPYGFKRLMYLLQALGLQQDTRVVTQSELTSLLLKWGGSDFKDDPVFPGLVQQIRQIELRRTTGNRPVVRATLRTTDAKNGLRLLYEGIVDNHVYKSELKIREGTVAEIDFPAPERIQKYMAQGNGFVTNVANRLGLPGVREMVQANDRAMVSGRRSVTEYLSRPRGVNDLEPLYADVDGIGLSSEGETAHISEALILPGLSIDQHATPAWMTSSREVVFFRAFVQKGLRGYFTTPSN